MVNIIKAEHQKAKRTMRKKFIWGFPLLTFTKMWKMQKNVEIILQLMMEQFMQMEHIQ